MAWLQNPRVMLYVALLAPCLLVNLWLYPGYPKYIVESAQLGLHENSIFPFTYASALALFGFGWYVFQRRGLGWLRSVLLAWPLPFAATSAFEGVYWNIGYIFRPGRFFPATAYGNPWVGDLINVSWVALAFVSAPYWRPNLRLVLTTLAVWAGGWILWVVLGFPQITDSSPTAAGVAFAINVPLKVVSFVLFATLVYLRRGGPMAEPSRTVLPLVEHRE